MIGEYRVLVKYDLDAKGTGHVFKRKELIESKSSEFQRIEISDLDILGRVLVLDNIIQLSELDSSRYHESFAHIPISNRKNPKKALIMGGGDGILAHELLKYPGLEIDLVDIDKEVCELSKKHLSKLGSLSMDNPRVRVHNMDALEFCNNSMKSGVMYDCIFADITDPHPESPSKSLLGDEALGVYSAILHDDGLFISQTDNIQIAPEHREQVENSLSKVFNNVGNFGIVALTLSSMFSFVWGSKNNNISLSPVTVETSWLNDRRYRFCLEFDEVT